MMIATQSPIAGETGRSGETALRGAADWLRLAAAPVFAMMALLTGALDDGAADRLCAATHHASPLSGMAPMYLLMSAVHLAPWLNLLIFRGSGAGRSRAGVRAFEPSPSRRSD